MALVGKVVSLLKEQGSAAVLIVPKWEAQWWWPLLVELAGVMLPVAQLSAGEALFQSVRTHGPCHPLGAWYPHADTVEWLVAVVPARAS